MMRILYRCLLAMHPPAFRRRFAAEMLFIFDETAPCRGALPLILDGVVSIARQWILRSGSWKPALAILGACVQLTAGGLIWLAPGHRKPVLPNTSVPDAAALEWLMRFIAASLSAIVMMVATAQLWMRSFVRTRAKNLRVAR
jgi:hypothetical protein